MRMWLVVLGPGLAHKAHEPAKLATIPNIVLLVGVYPDT
jgi:hypothetical protein